LKHTENKACFAEYVLPVANHFLSILVGKSDGKRPLGRPNVGGTIILKRILGCDVVNEINMAQDRDKWLGVVDMAINIRFP
jgi:hypothetical protein